MTFEQHCTHGFYLDGKTFGPNKMVAILPLLFTHAIIVAHPEDRNGYDDRWCYHSLEAAREALEAWDGTGEPKGWHRHPATGRRSKVLHDGNLEEWIEP